MVKPRRKFVILRHDHPRVHWDFMYEAGEGLRTWRLPVEPSPGIEHTVEELAIHRIDYLSYEGPVSGGRGRVDRVDTGTLTIHQDDADHILLDLEGRLFNGTVELRGSDIGSWTFRWEGTQDRAV